MTYNDEFLLSELNRYCKEYNKVPTYRDFENNKNFPNPTTYKTHFKTWNNALKLANLKINQLSKLTGKEYCEYCGSNHTIPNWYYKNDKRICDKCYSSCRNYLHGTLNPDSKVGMGVITEHVVYEVLKKEGDTYLGCKKCNTEDNFCSDYDLISEKYGTINVKSSKLCKSYINSYKWDFSKHNGAKTPNNYICLGFDKTRDDILKVWIIPKNSTLVVKSGIKITNSERGLNRVKQYEVDATPYNEVYQNLDITTLTEFRNIDIGEIYA